MGNSLTKVSIIIPCFNSERYLRECLESVINQTLKEIEIICVNDGSTDKTLDILKKFSSKDNRVVILDKTNSGYGDSMNKAISLSKGKYIGIVESDDFIDKKMYEELYEKAEKYDVDFIKSDYYKFTKTSQTIISTPTKGKYYNKVLNPALNHELFNFEMMNWTGLYKKSFLTKYNIYHSTNPGASYQDTSFWFFCFVHGRRVLFIKKPFYHYRIDNINSSINSKNKVFCLCDEYNYIYKKLKQLNLFNEYSDAFFYRRHCSYYYNYHRIDDCFKLEFANRYISQIKIDLNNNEFNAKMFPPSKRIVFWQNANVNILFDNIKKIKDTFFYIKKYGINKCIKLFLHKQ